MDHFSIGQVFITFLAGILSILSPCVLPVLPGFIAYFAGITVTEAKSKIRQHQLILNTLAFSLGFSTTFLMFGIIAGSISLFLVQNQIILQKIAGFILICFGLLQSGLIKIPALQKEWRVDQQNTFKKFPHYLRSLLIGILFAISWTPCYGPIIGGIFTLTASNSTFWTAIGYFLIYSLGFTFPLIIIAFSLEKSSRWLGQHKKFFAIANIIAGLLFILIGLLMLTSSLGNIVNWLNFIYTNNKLLFF
ncbi:hypothetical protein IT411_02795 [Candidatus Peregrinibacteria bacterium]|nr:hypothetical protein [Candidatus Peregrinibacteria bacterium]